MVLNSVDEVKGRKHLNFKNNNKALKQTEFILALQLGIYPSIHGEQCTLNGIYLFSVLSMNSANRSAMKNTQKEAQL